LSWVLLWRRKLIQLLFPSSGIGIGGAGIVGIFLGCLVVSIRQRKKRLAKESQSKDLPTPPSSKGAPISSTNFYQSTPSYPSSKLDLEKGSTYFGAHIFSYEELEEATNSFDPSRQLGDGGFGTVYYGRIITYHICTVFIVFPEVFS
jgi:hypothetical protein